jgi:DNA-directed RNA polymerase specialized sigma24 family protein
MSMIKVVSNQASREITVTEPAVMGCSTIEEMVEALGEDLAVNMIKNQLKVSFRAVVRRKLEEKDDNDEFSNADDAILAEDFSDWKPTLRITKTAEEKALEALGNLPPEVREAVLANFNNAR